VTSQPYHLRRTPRWARLPFVALLLAALGLGLSSPSWAQSPAPTAISAAPASWTTSNQHQLLPLYIYPNWWVSGNSWDAACANSNATDIGSTMIANPASGPSSSRNTDYAQIMADCHHYGQNVIGYVDTGYGARTIAAVEADIQKWLDQYNGSNTGVLNRFSDVTLDSHVDGIFLDEVALNPSPTVTSGDGVSVGSYYRTIFSYIRAHAPSTYNDVVANPGAPSSTDWMLHDTGTVTQIADEVVVFEGQYNDGTSLDLQHYVKPAWVSNYPASDIAMLVYNTSSANLSSACTTLKAKNAGLVDVTPETNGFWTDDPPWGTSSYWTSFRSSCG
jgi:hypothetical protein